MLDSALHQKLQFSIVKTSHSACTPFSGSAYDQKDHLRGISELRACEGLHEVKAYVSLSKDVSSYRRHENVALFLPSGVGRQLSASKCSSWRPFPG